LSCICREGTAAAIRHADRNHWNGGSLRYGVQNLVSPIHRKHKSPSDCHVGRDDIVYVVGFDIKIPANPGGALLYARSTHGGKTCLAQRRLTGVGAIREPGRRSRSCRLPSVISPFPRAPHPADCGIATSGAPVTVRRAKPLLVLHESRTVASKN
jgi:hypothetical protein